jgi:hypothetical protein
VGIVLGLAGPGGVHGGGRARAGAIELHGVYGRGGGKGGTERRLSVSSSGRVPKKGLGNLLGSGHKVFLF